VFSVKIDKDQMELEWYGKFENFSSFNKCLPFGSPENQKDNDFREKIKNDNGGKLDNDTINYILVKKKISLLKKVLYSFLPRLRNEPGFSIIRRKLENEKTAQSKIKLETTIKNSSNVKSRNNYR